MQIFLFARFLASRLAPIVVLLAVGARHVHAQSPALRLSLKAAAASTELPVGPWGSYSGKHAAPCYLANRKTSPLFAFPIVVGQQRDEILPIGSRAAGGKTRLRPERITVLRRAAGLAPLPIDLAKGRSTPWSRIVDGDADGFLQAAQVEFPKADLALDVVRSRDADGQPLPPEPWKPGSANITWSPAFAENDVEGLLIRVAFTNSGDVEQRFFVDLSGGLDSPDTLYTAADMVETADNDGNRVSLRHNKAATSFALACQTGDYAVRPYSVTDSQFLPEADMCMRDPSGAIPPTEGAVGASKRWALLRVSGIAVAPGATRVIFLCIGVGKDDAGALESAQTLLALAEDGKNREGLYAQALRAHAKSRYTNDEKSLERLIAQSLANTPLHDFRRVGVATRGGESEYRPGMGGWTALGWIGYRPDWAAAQLNAWFVTNTPPQKAINHVISVPPTDILALWELMQRTHDRDMLARFYPYAVWRFREFLESGREKEDDWLFTWPKPKGAQALAGPRQQSTVRAAGLGQPAGQDADALYAPDYSAYVILSARVLLACSKVLEKSGEEQAAFRDVIEHATEAMSKRLWDSRRGLFLAKPVSTPDAVTVVDREDMAHVLGIECLLPLVIGPENLSQEQDLSLRKQMADASTFLGRAGLRSLAKTAVMYRPQGNDTGGVRFGTQWLLWKSLLDRGEAAQAADLATRVLTSYGSAAEHTGGCPEWLNGETGTACGRLDFTGDSCALIALSDSYHRAGTVSCGWDTWLLDDHYEAGVDSLRVVFRALAQKPQGVLLCVMGKAGATYRAVGGVTGEFKADLGGVVTLRVPNDRTTQQIELTPVASEK